MLESMYKLSTGTIQALGTALIAVLTVNIVFFITWAYGLNGSKIGWGLAHLPVVVCLFFSCTLSIIGLWLLTDSHLSDEKEVFKVNQSRNLFALSAFSFLVGIVVAQFV
jgi:hypothetical protein